MRRTIYVKEASVASDTELAWCAGFFDGEGSTSVLKTNRDKYLYLRMSVSQKDPELLYKFQSVVGYGKVYHNKRGTSSWDCYKREEVEAVLTSLWVYLSPQKKRQAVDARCKVDSHRYNIDNA